MLSSRACRRPVPAGPLLFLPAASPAPAPPRARTGPIARTGTGRADARRARTRQAGAARADTRPTAALTALAALAVLGAVVAFAAGAPAAFAVPGPVAARDSLTVPAPDSLTAPVPAPDSLTAPVPAPDSLTAPAPAPGPSPVADPGGAPRAALTVVVSDASAARGAAPSTTYELRCAPAGGTHPDAAAACDRLDGFEREGRDPFAPVPAGQICTQIYGGAATAHVTGSWRGRAVDATFDRRDGCEIARWRQLVPVLPDLR